MCAEWLDSFETFYAHMGPKPTTKHSIERKENNKGYSKSNCMWATKKQQANNKTTSHVIEFNGESHTIAEWTEILGLPDNIINHRLRRGWTEERALSTPVRALRKVAEHGTTAMYSNNGCRCPECREAMRMSYHIRKAKAL
jgi:hypothetical protein